MPLPIFPYQEEGAAFIARRERCGLHDEMGVGKSAQAVRATDLVGGRRGLVICPASLRMNWINEFRKFGHTERTYCKGETIHDLVAWSRHRYDVLVTSYEQATNWREHITTLCDPVDFCILDEAQALKNESTKRSQAIYGDDGMGDNGIIEWAVQTWHLTGTPIPNDPMDVYTFLRFARAMPLKASEFKRRYFNARATTFGSRHTVREEMVPELRQLITNNAIRRTKAEAGIQLPPIFLTEALVDGDTDHVKALLASHPGLETAIVNAVRDGGLSFLDAQYVATLRRLIGEAKAVPYAHMLLDEIRGGAGKRVVFGIHANALMTVRDILLRHKVHAVLVNQSTPDKLRNEYVDLFQTDPKCMVFLGGIRSAGTGLTLTAACDIDMLESDWTPAGNAQALMRVHRIGQTRNVRGRFITLAKSFDGVVTRVVAEKTAAIAAVEGNAMIAAPT
jgi:SWI/SNF-related matrix-associated actin-dependent regulator 1 of chromatin subfamily A